MEEKKNEKTLFCINESKYLKLDKLYDLNIINKVYKAINLDTDEIVVIKKLRSLGNRKIYLENLKKELDHMRQVKSKHVISVYHDNISGSSSKTKSKNAFFITMEYSKHGDFFTLLKMTEKGFPTDIALFYFKQLIDGVQAIHKSGLMHRDIKLENILLNENMDLKITDLEFADRLNDDDGNYIKTQRMVGSEGYIAPEIYGGKEYYGDKADIYSCGITLYLFLNKTFPYSRASTMDSRFRRFVENREEYIRKYIKNYVSDDIVKLLAGMLDSDPEKRFSIDEIKELLSCSCDKENIMKYINTLIYKIN